MRITDEELGAALRIAKRNAARECGRCPARPKRELGTQRMCLEDCVYGWIHRICKTANRRAIELRRAKEKP